MWQLSHPRALRSRYLYHIAPTETPTRKLMAPAPISILSASSFQPSDSCMWYNNDSSLLTFLDMLADHIDWLNPAKTPSWFLSTFSDPEEVKRGLETEGGTVTKIDTGKLEAKVSLFSMETMRKLFLLEGETVGGEVLFFAMIPKQAVVGVLEVDKDGTSGTYCCLHFNGRGSRGDGLTDCVTEADLSSFFAAEEKTDVPTVDEGLDDSQVNTRAEILGAAERASQSYLCLVDGRRTSERRFPVPVKVMHHFRLGIRWEAWGNWGGRRHRLNMILRRNSRLLWRYGRRR